MRPQQAVNAKMVNGVAVAAPGYIPKAGKLTIEDIEAELALLAERMEYLNSALEELKKEEYRVCCKQMYELSNTFSAGCSGIRATPILALSSCMKLKFAAAVLYA